MTVTFIASSRADSLQQALSESSLPTGTIEAEYGDRVVEGSVFTMAHHGSRAGNRAPCEYENGEARLPDGSIFRGLVGFSHLDPDALGGAMVVLENKPPNRAFWDLVLRYDLKGLHAIEPAGEDPEAMRKLYALLAYFSENKVQLPRDGSVADITRDVLNAASSNLEIVSGGSDGWLRKGDLYREQQDNLNRTSFRFLREGVIFRISPEKVNHLYRTPDGMLARAVVKFDETLGSISLSFAGTPPAKNAIKILEEVLPGKDGDDPGGHASIAGSRRNGRYDLEAALAVVAATARELGETKT